MMEAIIAISMLVLSTLILTGLVTMLMPVMKRMEEVSVLGEEVDEERKETPKEKTKKEDVRFIPTMKNQRTI